MGEGEGVRAQLNNGPPGLEGRCHQDTSGPGLHRGADIPHCRCIRKKKCKVSAFSALLKTEDGRRVSTKHMRNRTRGSCTCKCVKVYHMKKYKLKHLKLYCIQNQKIHQNLNDSVLLEHMENLDRLKAIT